MNVADLLERKFACQDDITFHLIYMHSCFFRKLQFNVLFIYLSIRVLEIIHFVNEKPLIAFDRFEKCMLLFGPSPL